MALKIWNAQGLATITSLTGLILKDIVCEKHDAEEWLSFWVWSIFWFLAFSPCYFECLPCIGSGLCLMAIIIGFFV